MQIIINRYNLLCRIRRSGLLSITKCGICNPDFFRHTVRYNSVIERDTWNLCIRKQVSIHVGCRVFHQMIKRLLQLKQIRLFIKHYFSVFHNSSSCDLQSVSIVYIRNLYYCIQSIFKCQPNVTFSITHFPPLHMIRCKEKFWRYSYGKLIFWMRMWQ